MCGTAFLQGEGLVDTGLHIHRALLRLVVVDEASLPEGSNVLYALELVRLLAPVSGDGQLVAAQIPFGHELVQKGVLYEVGFHIPSHSCSVIPEPLVQVIAPAYHAATVS